VRGAKYVNICPSVARYNFHAYSAGGRLAAGTALLDKRIGYSEKLAEVIYNCQLCGGCDVSCKYALDMEVLEPLYEMRASCVEAGAVPASVKKMIDQSRDNRQLSTRSGAEGGQWMDGLKVGDVNQAGIDVIYYPGCRTGCDPRLWGIARATVSLLQKAGIRFGVAEGAELCCGGQAYRMGCRGDFQKQAQESIAMLINSTAHTLVTSCAECYQAFKVLYTRCGLQLELEVLHSTEYFDRLLESGQLTPLNAINRRVTYHDPCHLGRLGEPYIPWKGTQRPGHMRLFDPPKEFRRGTHGVYQSPRNILNRIPGLTLVEMDRTKEYAWCCGAGGGVKETNPDFAQWTALERLSEAESTGADALVTACPGCERHFRDTLTGTGKSLQVFDVAELLEAAI
jgi:Fe-S oxidoreductase